MQKWLLNDISIKTYNMLNIDTYDSIQDNIAAEICLWKIVIYAQTYRSIKKQKIHNTPFFHVFIEKICLSWFVWYDEYLGKIYILKKIDLGSYFWWLLIINFTRGTLPVRS